MESTRQYKPYCSTHQGFASSSPSYPLLAAPTSACSASSSTAAQRRNPCPAPDPACCNPANCNSLSCSHSSGHHPHYSNSKSSLSSTCCSYFSSSVSSSLPFGYSDRKTHYFAPETPSTPHRHPCQTHPHSMQTRGNSWPSHSHCQSRPHPYCPAATTASSNSLCPAPLWSWVGCSQMPCWAVSTEGHSATATVTRPGLSIKDLSMVDHFGVGQFRVDCLMG